MRTISSSVLAVAVAILLSGCASQSQITPIIVYVTTTPRVVTAEPAPSSTQDLSTPGIWETPASDVLLNYNPDIPFPPPAFFTQAVADRKFRFSQPPGFRFRDTSYSSLMENRERNLLIHLELLEHGGKANATGFLSVALDGQTYRATSVPTLYSLGEFSGWIADIESPVIYNTGIGQIIVVDVDASNLFYAIGIAKACQWQGKGKLIFENVVSSVEL